jgi:hypothetical protein
VTVNAIDKASANATKHSKTSNHEEVTVKNTKKNKTETTRATTAAGKETGTGAATTESVSDVPAQLQQIELLCGFGDPLVDADRTTSESLVRRVPVTIVERIIALAARNGGVVAGITFDPTAAKTALAEADQADAIATAAEMLARRAQDQSTRLRAGVTGNASAIRIAMRGYAKTAQGASLKPENDELRSLAKQAKAAAKGRSTRAKNAAAAAAATEVTAAPQAPAVAPAAAASVAPKVS